MNSVDKHHQQDQKMSTGNDDRRVRGTNFRLDFILIFHNVTDHRRGEYEHVKVFRNLEKLAIISMEVLF